MKPLAILLLLLVPTTAFAIDCGEGHFLGYFTGNDDVAAVNAALGIDATLLGKADAPPSFDGNFVINVSEWAGVDPIAGTWSWAGITNVNLLTMKANGGWAAYCVLPPCEEPEFEFTKRSFLSSSVSQYGTWDTRLNLEGKGLSHASAWSVDCVNAPEPTTIVMVAIAMLVLAIYVWSGRQP